MGTVACQSCVHSHMNEGDDSLQQYSDQVMYVDMYRDIINSMPKTSQNTLIFKTRKQKAFSVLDGYSKLLVPQAGYCLPVA